MRTHIYPAKYRFGAEQACSWSLKSHTDEKRDVSWQGRSVDASGSLDALIAAGVGRGDRVALVIKPGVGIGVAAGGAAWSFADADVGSAVLPLAVVAAVEAALRPRWVLWSATTSRVLARAGIRVAMAWDLTAVHRLLFGGWRADAGLVWAAAHGLAREGMPTVGPADLFSSLDDVEGDPAEPVRSDGYLRAEWAAGAWGESPERLRRWAALAEVVAARQTALTAIIDRPMATATARSESGAELLCAELTVEGIPMDRATAESIVAGYVGPRPGDEAEATALRDGRDAEVLRHVAPSVEVDLRSNAQVKVLLGRLGIEVADTRAWRLREVQDRHPVVGALLAWRKAERMGTTYGYRWLDEHLGTDGRLRGEWSGCDGAAGRMTASAGLHSMPADLRPAVMAETGMMFVRADLGQIEPRVLAVVSGDPALAAAAGEADMYAPVAAQLDVERATAKTAVLGAMYGATTGHGAQALRRLNVAYPVAMAYLARSAHKAEAGQDLRTYGGRLVPMGSAASADPAEPEALGVISARGRYGRNAMIQGAAAELFKMWAVTVRARMAGLDAHIVLCLHDELLVQTPQEHAATVAELVARGLDEAVHRWAPGTPVRFLADIAVIPRWSDAKG
jgi:DNA polymerase-1